MTNQIQAFIRFHSFSAFCPTFTSFCLIACLPNAGRPSSVLEQVDASREFRYFVTNSQTSFLFSFQF